MSGAEKKMAKPGLEENSSHRGKHQHNGWPRKGQQKVGPKTGNTFKGECEELGGNVYTYDGHAKAMQFQKTTEKIEQWAKKNCSHFALDVYKAIRTLEDPDTDEWIPGEPNNPNSTSGAALFKQAIDVYGKRKLAYRDNCTLVYTVVLGQCCDATKAKLKALEQWDDIDVENDLTGILKAIKSLMHNQLQVGRKPQLTAYESLRAFMNVRQQRHEATAEYLERFTAARDVLEHVGLSFGAMFQKIADDLLDSEYGVTREGATDAQAAAAEADAGESVLAVIFMMHACQVRYGEVGKDLRNNFLSGVDKYSNNVTGAYNLLVNWDPTSKAKESGPPLDGTAYAMDGGSEAVLATDGSKKSTGTGSSTCLNCNTAGHYWRQCRRPFWNADKKEPESNTTNAMVDDNAVGKAKWGVTFDEDGLYNNGAVLCQDTSNTAGPGTETSDPVMMASYDDSTKKVLPAGTIGMDSLSTVDLFCDDRMLTNIRKVQPAMNIRCNAGFKTVDHMGHLAGYGDVWYDPKAVANILSLGRVTKRFKVTFSSEDTEGFVLHLPDGRTRSFKQTDRGLYATQFLERRDNHQGVALTIETVEGNKTHFTKREVKQAERARRLQTTLLFPSDRHFSRITEILQDCPVTAQDVENARAIFGPNLGALKGKTTKSKSAPVFIVPVTVPSAISERLTDLHLHADVCFVNGIGFLVSISDKIKFCTAEAVGSRTNDVLVAALKKIHAIYRHGGYRIRVVSIDGEFTSAKERIMSEAHMEMNSVAAGEHAPVIERHIRHLKEGVRGMFNMLPFDKKRRLPDRIIIELVYAKTFFKNAVPALDGISDVLAPREIITKQRINYNRHCVLMFGQYVQTHEEHDNTMKSRTIGAIAMRPTGARQGGYFFFSLETGRIISRNHWTESAMPRDAIDRVHSLAGRNSQVGVEFRNRAGEPLEDTTDPDEHDCDPEASAAADTAGVELPHDETLVDSAGDEAQITGVDEYEILGDENADAVLVPEGITIEQGDEIDITEQEQDLEARYGPRTTAYNLRPRRAPPGGTYNLEELLAMGDVPRIQDITSTLGNLDKNLIRPRSDTSALGVDNCLHEVVMAQYGVQKGLRMFGEKGTSAVHKEMKQIHDRHVLKPVDPGTMSKSDKSEALRYLMFLKEKADGTIKGRGCADGRKQRRFIDKDSASSPTISTEALFLIITIAAKEKRKVGTVDVPGAYLQTDLKDEKVIVKFEGKMAELLEMIDPKMYRKYLVVEKGKKVLYAELAKVLYGILRGALLFWQKVSAQLIDWGFTINPYDWCVANKEVKYETTDSDGKGTVESAQMTLGWHVDDFIITHKSQEAVDEFIARMDELYGGTQPLTVHRGEVHRYLGMDLDFSVPGKVRVGMQKYAKDMLDEGTRDFEGEAATPAAEHLFATDPEATKLGSEQATLFHHLTAKALFLCKRARPDTQLAVGFLCSRVKEPDVDDWKKLRRLFQYIRGTLELGLTLEADEVMVAKWWIDASFAVHPDCRSQSGAVLSLGKGAPYSGCQKQKVNGKSSTEVELIAVDDFVGQVLWTQYFLQAQGYEVPKSVVYQDNQSAILLEKNGRMSGSKRTRHINVRYYFITDRVNKGEIKIEFCPTGNMVADVFTKPLQGAAFRKFRNAILNIPGED